MFKKLILIMLCVLFVGGGYPAPAAANDGVTILNYHDVVSGSVKNEWDVTKQNLEAQFAYLKTNGYNPISLEQYIAANEQGAPLPDKPILITFDDGYISFYRDVFPLLKQYNYPAVLAIVTSWMTYAPPDVGKLVSWDQMKEMEASGLVKIALHSHDLHRAVPANKYGDSSQAGSTMIYKSGQYEALDDYKARVTADLKQGQDIFERELGHKVAAMVWPYGEYTQFAIEAAKLQGLKVFFGLGGGANPVSSKSLTEAKRGIVYKNPNLERFAKFVKAEGFASQAMRAAQLDIDLIYDPTNPRRTDVNLKLAIERFYRSGINTVILHAMPDPKGDGNIESVYFHTNAAPVSADVFDHIARKIKAEGLHVYAMVPTISGQWLLKDNPEDTVMAYDPKGKGWYKRATPFSKNVQTKLQALFTDLAAYSSLNGILFQDDLYLNDYEDFSPAAKQVFKEKFGRELTPEILQNQQIKDEWTRIKSAALTDLTRLLIQTVRQYKPYASSARNIYAEPVMNPGSEEWYAQNFQQYLNTYDYTVIMAYPFMEKQGKRSVQWMGKLADAALQDRAMANRVIFKLQTYDWEKKRWIADKELLAETQILREKGAIHFGYYPENVFDERIGLLPQDMVIGG